MKNLPKNKIISHGEILEFPFHCPESRNAEFRIHCTLNSTDKRIKTKPVLIDLQFILGAGAGNLATYPLRLNTWSPSVVYIPATQLNKSLFDDYRIFYKVED